MCLVFDKADNPYTQPLSVFLHKLVEGLRCNLNLAIGVRSMQQIWIGGRSLFYNDAHMRYIKILEIRHRSYHVTVVKLGLGLFQSKVSDFI